MINTNANRWQSVRLLFDKHIIGGNLKSNYQRQRSVEKEGGGRVFAGLASFLHSLYSLNGTAKGRHKRQVDVKSSSSGLGLGWDI